METTFSLKQLQDPDLQAAEKVLQQCVHCGFCNATCPTYQISQDEADGPRGRIWIMRSFLTEDRQPSPEELNYLDRCLTCLSCTTTCPAGVEYLHLTDIARRKIERPLRQKLLRSMMSAILPYASRFGLALKASKLVRPWTRFLPRLLARMVELTEPANHTKPLAPGIYPAIGEQKLSVLMLAGCAQQHLDAEINHATVRVLNRLGIKVIVPAGAGCCGALTEHMGQHDKAQDSIRSLIQIWQDASTHETVDHLVINASGCGFHIKDWGFVMQDDPIFAKPASHFASLSRDVSEIIAQVGIPPASLNKAAMAKATSVALHMPCSLQHGQKITTLPKTLLETAGFYVQTPADPHLCCGAAGTYALLQPESSDTLRRNKAKALKNTGALVVSSSNMGCMNHLRPETDQPVVHLVQLLDWATGGPQPPGIA